MIETNFRRVSKMNVAFNNAKGDPTNINWGAVRNQSLNIMDEFIELMKAEGLNEETIEKLSEARKSITLDQFTNEPNLKDTRDALCDINVFSYGAHHLMGIDADRDMQSVVGGVMTRFIKNDADKEASIALHASKGVTDVYFEGEYPTMVMKSGSDQPDAPKGKFIKSASYQEPVFYDVTAPASAEAPAMPADQEECVVWLKSGARLFGRILQGQFCVYEAHQDSYVDYSLVWERDVRDCVIVPRTAPSIA